MQFLFPSVLWGLLALSIPLIVHLFNFRRTKKVYFSNVALLKTVETKSSAFRKLKQLLIMAARMLFLASLIFAFAQPIFFKNKANLTAKPVGINGIYLDNSLSMQNTTESKRFLDLAIIKIDELLSIFNRSSNVQMTTNDFDGQDQFVTNASKVKDRLTTTDFSEIPRTLEQVYKRQRSIAQKHNPSAQNHFFWFSDFQKSTVGRLENVKIDSNDKVHLIPVTGKASQNVFVDSVWLSLPAVREMQNNVLNVKVYNSGSKGVEKLPLKLFIDNIQASTSSVNIASNSSATASFNFTVKERGVHRGKILFDDQPITFDNDYYFVLNASPSIRVLHLFGQRSPQNYLSKMYANDSLFKYTSYSVSNFDPGQVQNADMVVLEGVSTIDGETKLSLENFLASGGSVVISPSENPVAASYLGFLGKYGFQNIEVVNEVPSPENFVDINEPDKTSPFYADVFERSSFNSLVSLPKSTPKLQWGGAAEKLLSFRNGRAFLTRTKVGDGVVYLLASPLNAKFGNFAEHAFFVPTFYKMAYLSSKSDRLAYNFSESSISFFMPNAPKNATYKLKNDKLEIIPVQRLLGKTLNLTLPKSSELSEGQLFGSGFYDLVINGKVEKTLALNHDHLESKLDTYSSENLRDIFENQKNVEVYDDISDGSFIEAFRDTSLGKPLWKYFVVAALFFLLVEILLIRFLKS
ncbi:MAG: BatA domain-containing protein [Leadbetterella sp.]|nr:BatA domain-containing protein [Leadbetterella sp.]